MKKRLAFLGSLVLCSAVFAQPIDVSLISLIANPKDFDGRQIRVIGFARMEFEGNAIYLHRGDYLQGITKNGLWLGGGPAQKKSATNVSDRYVIVEGVFSMQHQGHLGLWSGSIQKITRLEPWSASK
jgi:hypothetical protein